jgi:hypothetical protein
MAAVRTFYEVLNVSPDAEPVVIEAAYRALMKKYHPDQGGAERGDSAAPGRSATEINRAYAVLRDAPRRAEYDQTEWIRQRDIQLAAYQLPPPPRPSNFFAWGGWLVSLVLVGMIALLASKGVTPQLSAAEEARAAAMAVPDQRSQPLAAGQPVVTAAEEAEIRAAAFGNRAKQEEPKTPVPAPVAVPVPVPTPPVAAQPAPAPAAVPVFRPVHRPAAAPRRARAHRGPTASAPGRHKDFLERQGYIY